MGKVALVVGATGIVGKYLVDQLSSSEQPTGPWKVYALARRSHSAATVCFKPESSFTYIQANLLDREDAHEKLSPLKDVTHVFWVTWVARDTEEKNIADNSKMLQNTLDAIVPVAKKLTHIALQTGAKHYLGPFTGNHQPHEAPFREDLPRLAAPNFYYSLEDIVFKLTEQNPGITWSVHRPDNILGFSAGNLMNLVGSLAVYAAIAKHEGVPFNFPGNSIAWENLNDLSSGDLIAGQEIWASTDSKAANQAFNIANGDLFKWKRMWTVLAEELGVEPGVYSGQGFSVTEFLKGKEETWDKIVEEKGLHPTKLADVGHGWFIDAVLNVPFECVTSMNKSKEFGFYGFRDSEKSLQAVLHEMVEAKVIPSFHERYYLRSTHCKK